MAVLARLVINPQTNQPYYHDFPVFTIRDMIQAYQQLKESSGYSKDSYRSWWQHRWSCNYWNGLLKNRTYLNISFLLPPMQYYHPGPLLSMHRSAWRLKQTLPGWTNDADARQKGLTAARSIALLSYRHYNDLRYHTGQEINHSIPIDNDVAKQRTITSVTRV